MIPKGCSSSFTDSFSVHSKINVKDEGAYVFDGALNSDSNIIAASLSSNNIKLYALEALQNISCLSGHKRTVTGIRFSDQDPNILYSSSLDGTICLWDIRKQEKPALLFKDDTNQALKPLESFDINRDEQFICAGSAVVHDDAFLIFWDVRTSKLLGGYWNSHSDDITQVKFHPEKSSQMASGGDDGLINIFDLSKSCEDDALMQTLNIGSSVGKFSWCLGSAGDRISCITQVGEHQLWDIDEGQTISMFDRDSLKEPGKEEEVPYLFDVFQFNNLPHLAAGTNSGAVDILSVSDDEYSVLARLHDGHKGIVRSILWNDKLMMFITGGEDGVVCCWKSDSQGSLTQHASSKVGKVESTFKSLNLQHKKKPYTKTS